MIKFWKSGKRRKGSQRPTQPVDESANSPTPPASNPLDRQIPIDHVESRGTIKPSVIEADRPAKPQLWIRAYDAICEDDPDLVAAYKAVLSSELRPEAVCDLGADSHDAGNAQQQMGRQVQEGLRRTEKAAAKMDKIHDGMRVVSSVNEIISAAVKYAPEAAAAWAGICLLFGVGVSPSREKAFSNIPRSLRMQLASGKRSVKGYLTSSRG